jgi:hypothetical protein
MWISRQTGEVLASEEEFIAAECVQHGLPVTYLCDLVVNSADFEGFKLYSFL